MEIDVWWCGFGGDLKLQSYNSDGGNHYMGDDDSDTVDETSKRPPLWWLDTKWWTWLISTGHREMKTRQFLEISGPGKYFWVLFSDS